MITGDCTGHVLTGHELAHVDPRSYPHCQICGAKPDDGYKMQWWSEKHVTERNKRLGL